MRRMAWIVTSLCMAAAAGSPLVGQASDALKDLNAVLASSCSNSPTLQRSAEGTVVRTDADGGTWTLKLTDIDRITVDSDRGAHVLLMCKANAACIERVPAPGATRTSTNLLAFSITPFELGDSVLRRFQELHASVVKTRVR